MRNVVPVMTVLAMLVPAIPCYQQALWNEEVFRSCA